MKNGWKTDPKFILAPILAALLSESVLAATQLPEDVDIYQGDGKYQLRKDVSTTIGLSAGQPIYLVAKGTTTSNTSTGIMMFGMQVACGTSSSNIAGAYQSTQNHEGSLAYPSSPGRLSLQVRYLFVAPTAGTYTCWMLVKNLAGKDGDSKILTLKKGGETYITDPSRAPGAAAWGTELDDSDFVKAKKPETSAGNECTRTVLGVTTAIDPPISGESEPNLKTYCKGSVHLGPNLPAGNSVYSLKSENWKPANGKTTIKAVADIELTACYYGTGSCPKYAWGAVSDKSKSSYVKTRLIVQQFPAGSQTPCSTTSTNPLATEIKATTHHLKVYHDLKNIPVKGEKDSSGCGADSYFVSKVYVIRTDGNPVRIEDSRYSQNILMNEQ